MKTRLPIETFDLPVNQIRRGYRSAVYFNRTKSILEKHKPTLGVTMQVFQKGHSVLCGIDQARAILSQCTGHWSDPDKAIAIFDDLMDARKKFRSLPWEDRDRANLWAQTLELEDALNELWVNTWEDLHVEALYDGDDIDPWETVMHIRGQLSQFAHLESVYLGVLARGTMVATNTRRVVEAANEKPVLFFADRFDHFATQGGDGYAAHIGGAQGVATDAMGSWYYEAGLGTMPHALIAAFDGSVVEATRAFADTIPNTNIISLVDFNNDCVRDALDVAREFEDKLWGIRLDTSENMVDRSIADHFVHGGDFVGDSKPTGVNPMLVNNVREALDNEGFDHVKIIVSGGFNVDKITAFERADITVDGYAVGSSLLKGSYDFTADVVAPVAKEGRRLRNNPRLEKVD